MTKLCRIFLILALALPFQSGVVRADKASDEAAMAAALALLGIAALAHSQHDYPKGYHPSNDRAVAEFERGYRDGVHGYAYNEVRSTKDYAHGYQAGDKERENSMAHRKHEPGSIAPPMAMKGCTDLVAQNFAVNKQKVHVIKSKSPRKHEWLIETAVGQEHMVCKMRDTGEVMELKGGKM